MGDAGRTPNKNPVSNQTKPFQKKFGSEKSGETSSWVLIYIDDLDGEVWLLEMFFFLLEPDSPTLDMSLRGP